MDFAGSVDGTPFPGGEGRDQMIELGSGRLVPGFEDQLEGAVGGEERTVTITFPDDYGAPELAGKEAEFAVTVREVKAKQLPELNDEFAEEAGFDTLDELREDIRTRMATEDESRIEAEFREAALDAAVANATLEVPDALVEARAREMWESMLHTLAHQGINRETYLRLSGRSEEETIESSKPDAETALRREAVLAAVAEAESLEPTEEEMLEAVSEAAPGRARVAQEAAGTAEVQRPPGQPQGRSGAAQGTGPVAESAKPAPVRRQIPDHATFTILAERPGVDHVNPLLVFARVVRHGPSAI